MTNTHQEYETAINNEKSMAMEDYIADVAEKYKQGEYREVILSLSNGNKTCVNFTNEHNIQLIHPHIPLYFDDPKEVHDPKYLPSVINQILKHGHGWSDKRIEVPSDIAIITDGKEVEDIEIPPLWKKVQALCCLEEWIHGLDYLKNGQKNNEDSENKVALYLHKKLGIKLPKYFLQMYERDELNIPIEDHNFDSVKDF